VTRLLIWPIVVGALLCLCGCSVGQQNEFAIYLATQDVTTIEAMAIDIQHITLEDEPVLTVDDIVSYSEEWHEIILLPRAYERFQALKVPVTGRPFVVCVGNERIYAGAFWTPISSLLFDGVTIWQPLGGDNRLIRIEFGYPSAGYGTGEDPRSDERIMDALRRAGKLK